MYAPEILALGDTAPLKAKKRNLRFLMNSGKDRTPPPLPRESIVLTSSRV